MIKKNVVMAIVLASVCFVKVSAVKPDHLCEETQEFFVEEKKEVIKDEVSPVRKTYDSQSFVGEKYEQEGSLFVSPLVLAKTCTEKK